MSYEWPPLSPRRAIELARAKLEPPVKAMPSHPESRIYRLAGIWLILGVASYVIPGFVPNPEGGFAGSGPAILTFLGLLAVNFIFSIYLLVATLREFKGLSLAAKLVGVGPSFLFGAILVWIVSNLIY